MDRTRTSGTIARWGWLLAAAVVGACAQTAPSSQMTAVANTVHAAAATTGTVFDPKGPGSLVLRQIEDPSTGDLWLLLRDAGRPGGPGRLVLVRQRSRTQKAIAGGLAQPWPAEQLPVIQTGDALTVEEHTAVIDARLEAVALEPAIKGAQFKARLKIGGIVVRVVAVSPGRADFPTAAEVEP